MAMSDPAVEKRKNVFIYTVLAVWGVVALAATYDYIFRGGPIPDPILLGVPTGVWLAVHPPLPSALREERQTDGTGVG